MKPVLPLIAGLTLSVQVWAAPGENAVLAHYADLAHAKYEDSLITAQALQKAVDRLVASPTNGGVLCHGLRVARRNRFAPIRRCVQSAAARASIT